MAVKKLKMISTDDISGGGGKLLSSDYINNTFLEKSNLRVIGKKEDFLLSHYHKCGITVIPSTDNIKVGYRTHNLSRGSTYEFFWLSYNTIVYHDIIKFDTPTTSTTIKTEGTLPAGYTKITNPAEAIYCNAIYYQKIVTSDINSSNLMPNGLNIILDRIINTSSYDVYYKIL